MKKNIGTIDRVIRVIVAAIVLTLYVTNVITGTIGIVLLIIAVVFLLTSIINFCPIYKIFGMSTCKTKK